MKYLSLFSGIGGFELGIQQAYSRVASNRQADIRIPVGQEAVNGTGTHLPLPERHNGQPLNGTYPKCIGYSEIDKYAIKVYERRFDHENYGDATTIVPDKLPDFDLLVGGFPCQAFSVAGKRSGFADPRGTLFFDILRIARDKRPEHLVLENVKGLLSHDNGETFKAIIGLLTNIGYRVEWQVLNSKDFGVPQNRERVFIVGHLRNECGRQIFPIRDAHEPSIKRIQGHTANTLTARYAGGQATGSYVAEGQLNAQEKHCETCVCYKSKQVINPNPEVSDDHCETCTCHVFRSAATRTRAYAGKPETLEVRPDNISNTINSVNKDYYATDLTRIRRLTPRECERLQGFPDGWTKYDKDLNEISDTQRYKMCGNAVTVNVVEAVVKKLVEACTM